MSLTIQKVFETFYHGIISLLPMRDSDFISQLQKSNLLPAHVETTLKSLHSSKEKASYFLDCVIKPELHDNIHNKLDQLLTLMMDDNDDDIKEFAKKVTAELHRITSGDDETQIGNHYQFYNINLTIYHCTVISIALGC